MRSLVTLAAASAAIVAASAMPASAAKWDCQGPSYVCGDAAPSAKQANYGKKSKKGYSAPGYVSAGGTSGKASYYWQGTRTASGARFNPGGLTAAHRTLPFGTRVLVTNRVNGKSVVVTINDRGPFVGGRIIDLSRGAAQAISMTGMGVAPVSISVLGRG
ncbi:MAG: septal ring lytic transglycosylase RlpA family protein [Hyphomicrobium sp.]